MFNYTFFFLILEKFIRNNKNDTFLAFFLHTINIKIISLFYPCLNKFIFQVPFLFIFFSENNMTFVHAFVHWRRVEVDFIFVSMYTYIPICIHIHTYSLLHLYVG